MKTMKKVAALVFALLLVLSTVSLSVSAEGETGNIGITITADKSNYLYPGEIVTFTINISTDFNYTAMRWPVMYTTKAFEPVINGDSDTSYGNVVGYGPLDTPESYLESAMLPASSEAFGGTYSKTNYSGILIQWTAGTTSEGLGYYNYPNGYNCITFQLRVKEGYTANRGVGTVAIPVTAQAKKVFYYQGITTPSDLSTLYKLNSDTCNFTGNPCTVNIISEAAGIIPAYGTDTVIDTDHDIHYIYGFTENLTESVDIGEDTIEDFVELTGGATFELIPNETGNYSTGAVMRVYEACAAGETRKLVDEFTIVIYGDVDGDGEVAPADMALIITAITNDPEWSWYGLYDDARFLACDVSGDGNVYPEDITVLRRFFSGQGIPDQTHSGAGLITTL